MRTTNKYELAHLLRHNYLHSLISGIRKVNQFARNRKYNRLELWKYIETKTQYWEDHTEATEQREKAPNLESILDRFHQIKEAMKKYEDPNS